jgi:hypothetical protein
MRFLPAIITIATTFLIPVAANARSIYLNGTDISSARGQELKNVTLHINEKGDVFIVAPHYQVNEEDTFVPLSKYVQGMNIPVHKNPKALSKSVNVPTKFTSGQIEKAGDESPADKPPEENPNKDEAPSETKSESGD